MTKFGDRRVDDYFWLREKDNPEVIAYLEAENRYTEAAMKPLEGFRDKLYKEMLARIKETDESVPYRKQRLLVLPARGRGPAIPDLLPPQGHDGRARGGPARRERARQGAQVHLGRRDGREPRRHQARVHRGLHRLPPVHAAREGPREPAAAARSAPSASPRLAWAADNRTLFYVEEHETTKRSHRLHRHALGGAGASWSTRSPTSSTTSAWATRAARPSSCSPSPARTRREMRVLRANDPAGDVPRDREAPQGPRVLPRPPRGRVLHPHQRHAAATSAWCARRWPIPRPEALAARSSRTARW